MKKFMVVLYILIGLLPTIFMFATHDVMCKYDMNPLCYLKCSSFAIIALPLLVLDETMF